MPLRAGVIVTPYTPRALDLEKNMLKDVLDELEIYLIKSNKVGVCCTLELLRPWYKQNAGKSTSYT
jgi:hypothetical protein